MKIWVLLSRTNLIENDRTGVLHEVYWEKPDVNDLSKYFLSANSPPTEFLKDQFNDILSGEKTHLYNEYYWIQSFEHKY